jgi:hypothetical protein
VTDVVDLSATLSSAGGDVGNLGYVHLLTIVQQFVGDGDGLFYKKALNISSLWVLSFAWYAIALLLGGRALARSITIACACMPTLWYFYCVLLRDLLTVALHSVVLASAMLFFFSSKRRSVHLFVLTFALIASACLRPVTLYFNAVLILVVVLAIKRKILSSRGGSWQVGALILSVLVVQWVLSHGSLSAATDFNQKTQLSALRAQADTIAEQSGNSINSPTALLLTSVKAVPLVIASEPTIASKALNFHDPEQFRGIMNGVWFALFAPFAVLGIVMGGYSTFKSFRSTSSEKRRKPKAVRGAIRIGGPVPGSSAALLIVLLYCAEWYAISVVSQDGTRWRLPIVPALCLIAIWAYKRINVGERFLLLGVWIFVVCAWRIMA